MRRMWYVFLINSSQIAVQHVDLSHIAAIIIDVLGKQMEE